MSENKVSISVIVPVYNVENYLPECLDSILQQDFQDYEVICVNDASTDGSALILYNYEKRYVQLKVLTHAENKGLSAARNTGLETARGKYVWFIDSDDFIAEGSLIEMYNAAETYNTDIIYFDMVRIYDEQDYRKGSGKEKDEEYTIGGKVFSGKEYFCIKVYEKSIRRATWMQFMRREFLVDHNLNFYEGIVHEDALFYFLCSMAAQRVLEINKGYYFYRHREGSIMDTKNFVRAESLFVVMIHIITYWYTHTFSEDENRAIGIYFEDIFKLYQYYSCFGCKSGKLSVGRSKEKLLYEILHKKDSSRYLTLGESQIVKIKEVNQVIVFGCGWAAYDIVSILNKENIEIDTIAVSKRKGNPERFCGIEVEEIDHLACQKEEAVIVIGVTEKYRSGIMEKLEELGYRNIIIPEKVE